MCSLKKPSSTTGCQITPSEPGLTREESNISPPKVDTEDIYSKNQVITQSQNIRKKSSMLEFRLENNEVIWETKPIISLKNTQDTKSLLISDRESTLKGQDLRGFWRECSKELSRKLWSPTETDLPGLDTSFLSGFSASMVHSSFLTKNPKVLNMKNSQRTSWLSSRFSQPDTTERENIQEKMSYCRKIRFYPSTRHKEFLTRCFGANRYLVNQLVESLRDSRITISDCYSIEKLRKFLKYRNKDLTPETSWLKEIPSDLRDESVKQFSSNIKTCVTLLKRKYIKNFNMKFKSIRKSKQTCYFPPSFLKENTKKNAGKTTYRLFPQRIPGQFVEFAEDISKLGKYGRLTVTREKNKYYMIFPMERDPDLDRKPYKSVALDPGVRTFQTFYSEEGLCGKIGDGIKDTVREKFIRVDHLKSVIDTLEEMRSKTRFNIRKKCCLLRAKAKNIVLDLHRKTCSWLTKNFEVVFLPYFRTKVMTASGDRTISRATVKAMLSLSHYAFKQRLLHMAKSRGCTVVLCSEAYTSKTCGSCGHLNENLGASKVFTCASKSCSFTIDRDYNGARNIYIRNTQNFGSDQAR